MAYCNCSCHNDLPSTLADAVTVMFAAICSAHQLSAAADNCGNCIHLLSILAVDVITALGAICSALWLLLVLWQLCISAEHTSCCCDCVIWDDLLDALARVVIVALGLICLCPHHPSCQWDNGVQIDLLSVLSCCVCQWTMFSCTTVTTNLAGCDSHGVWQGCTTRSGCASCCRVIWRQACLQQLSRNNS